MNLNKILVWLTQTPLNLPELQREYTESPSLSTRQRWRPAELIFIEGVAILGLNCYLKLFCLFFAM